MIKNMEIELLQWICKDWREKEGNVSFENLPNHMLVLRGPTVKIVTCKYARSRRSSVYFCILLKRLVISVYITAFVSI